MTLEEAKERLQELLETNKLYLSQITDDKTDIIYRADDMCKDLLAIDTALKALEDSIPKEKIREKIKELGKDIPMMTPRYFEWDSSEVIKLLKELLGE